MSPILVAPQVQLAPTPYHAPPSLATHPTSLTKQSLYSKAPTHIPNHHHGSFLTLCQGLASSSDYASVIESCSCFHLGRGLHGHVVKMGYGGHEFLETKLLQMYGRCGAVEDAVLLFDEMPLWNVHSLAGVLSVYIGSEDFERAFLLFVKMLSEGFEMEFFIFPAVLKACSGLNVPDLGRQLHGFLIKSLFGSNLYVGNALIDMYGKCGCLDDAKMGLETMPQRDIVSWNSTISSFASNGMVFEALECMKIMESRGCVAPNIVTWTAAIGGCAQNGYDAKALELFYCMQEAGVKPNARTLASLLPACARLQNLRYGKVIHGYILRHDYITSTFVNNGLVDVYRRCGNMGYALDIFLKFATRNCVSFNTMIVGFCENEEVQKARELFDQMEASGVRRDSISWNSMISGYVGNGQYTEAFKLFKDMQMEEDVEIDSFTLGSSVAACANMNTPGLGKVIHSYAITRGLHSNSFVGGALVEMYCRFGDVGAAQVVFDNIPITDTATWNVLISGYAQCNQMENVHELLARMREHGIERNAYTWNGLMTAYLENEFNELALELFYEIQTRELPSDIFTVGMALHACSKLATIERGKQIHGHSIRNGYDMDVHIGATLIDMYAKCGKPEHARRAFNRILIHNLVSWNSMLAAYAMHGQWKEGITFFYQMLNNRIHPDQITFLSVLSLCAHAGAVDEGDEYFNMMAKYGIKPNLKHNTCMVDLYSRAGKLQEAYRFVEKMVMEPDVVVWSSLLNGCVIHGNVELGKLAARKLIKMDETNAGNYVLLANLFASSGRWDNFAKTWQTIKDKGMEKSPGYSWVEVKDQVHVFLANDRSHKQIDEIYATLDILCFHLYQEGYHRRVYHLNSRTNTDDLISTH